MEKNSEKRGNEYKSYQKYNWVWYKRNLNNCKLVYLGSKENEWNIQNDVVKKINLLVKEGKMGKYGVEFDYVIKCEVGNEIDKVVEVGGEEYKVKEWEVKESSNMVLVFSWDNDGKEDKKIKIDLGLELDK
jgi:hypothetical protein